MEQNQPKRSNGNAFRRFSSGTEAERITGNPPPPHPPLRGVGGVGERHSPNPASDRVAWVRENLPSCVAVADEFRAVFGDVRLAYASENGHVIGQRSQDGVVPTVGSMAIARKAVR